jgi:hypothetical protein
MLSFKDLSKGQKKYIAATITEFPEVVSKKFLTVSEIKYMFDEMKNKRREGGVKVGYPIWLVTQNRVGKSQYKLPLPSKAELEEFLSKNELKGSNSYTDKPQVQINSEIDYTEQEFLDELRANGIKI